MRFDAEAGTVRFSAESKTGATPAGLFSTCLPSYMQRYGRRGISVQNPQNETANRPGSLSPVAAGGTVVRSTVHCTSPMSSISIQSELIAVVEVEAEVEVG